ncbi:uncharacterized protein SCHCODRAFT_02066417 [Schizophyllum commune H4-8]|uniref:uncharacterized protein n=1 Tax=Schizophyllum commune (strain H4-8 / FGSC 9210) TaxID=578458 RepID=UPI002160276B|nr:uncharacterized protein SCHCODRAFT_02066417 [Schizophyllum commune H4-8]KAI5887486.1 hypothetical protein SCHCODRAFT_02066417 [Schizophyllum commune H4-8]
MGCNPSGPCRSPPRSKLTRCRLMTGRLLIFPSSTSAHALYGTAAAAWEVCRNPRCAGAVQLIASSLHGHSWISLKGNALGDLASFTALEPFVPLPKRHPSSRRPHLHRRCRVTHNKRHTRYARTSAPPLRSHALYLLEPGRRPSCRVPPSKSAYLVPKGTVPRAHDVIFAEFAQEIHCAPHEATL